MTKTISTTPFTVNGRTYHPSPRPVVVICLDGCADEYLSTAIAHDRMPVIAKMAARGYRGLVRGALPSFTNVNNCAMVTGTPPSQTGMSGNYIIDPDTGDEVMTNSSRFLRNDTILAAAANASRKVAMVTAKDKLRELLSKGLSGISLSMEKLASATLEENGLAEALDLLGPVPEIYSADASLSVLRAGVRLLQNGLADFLYLTTTDYMQHKYPPAAPEILDFYERIDKHLGELLALSAVVGITADHGMNAKCNAVGQPNVIYLESRLAEQFGPGNRVICPITDPYVVHHGALGAAVMVYHSHLEQAAEIGRWILHFDGVTEVYDRETASRKLELPADRIGDLFVLAARDWVIGRTPAHHDLSQLQSRLRSHGGRYEEMVPMLLSEPLNDEYAVKAASDPRNFDIFDFTCNGHA